MKQNLIVASLLILISSTVITLMTSCSGHDSNVSEDASSTANAVMTSVGVIQGTPGLAKQLIAENTYIDLDVTALDKIIADASAQSRSVDEGMKDQVAMAKAAVYRFYSNITTDENEGYLLKDCTPESLNISPELFNAFKESIIENNAQYKNLKGKGGDVTIAPITDDYLNSLLED